jgi:hypothetical protein
LVAGTFDNQAEPELVATPDVAGNGATTRARRAARASREIEDLGRDRFIRNFLRL